MSDYTYINIAKLTPPEYDGRFELDEDSDRELSESIKEMGVLEPIIVRKKNSKFEIIAGSCRFRATKLAGLDSIPCIIVKADDSYAEKIKLHENLKRLPLNHIDQGLTFARLRVEFKMTEKEISDLSGKSIPYISQHICFIQTDESIIQAVQKKEINFSVARELMLAKDPVDRNHLTEYAIKGGASVDTVKHWVQEVNSKPVNTDHETSDEPLPPQTFGKYEPTFKCQACEESHVIKEMQVVRLCLDCNFVIFDELRKAKAQISSNP